MAKNGNAIVLEWYFKKVEETGRQAFLNVNHRNSMGYAPIFLACQHGHKSTLSEQDDKEFIRANRLRCVKTLLSNGSLASFRTALLGMTPLHWAAYYGDAEVADELLKCGAPQILNTNKHNPVDIAGFRGNQSVVEVFCEHLAR